jgi:hypothetical protein
MKPAPRIPVWRTPIALAVLTLAGLTAALIGGEPWRWPACVALAVPVAVGTWFYLRPRRDSPPPD